MPAATAKLPIIRNSGSVATWALVRNSPASVASTLPEDLHPLKSAVPPSPINPETGASGICRNTPSHRKPNAIRTNAPGWVCANDARPAKSIIAQTMVVVRTAVKAPAISHPANVVRGVTFSGGPAAMSCTTFRTCANDAAAAAMAITK